MPDLTLPQAQLIADAASGRCWHHNGRDFATGTHSHRDVTRTAASLVARQLLVAGDPCDGGWLWRPTEDGHWAASAALHDLATRVEIAQKQLGRWKPTREDTR